MDIMDTIDRIGETLTSASKDIAKKAKDFVDVNTVKTAINDQKKIISKAYERIGEQYYKEHVEAGNYEYEIEFEIIGEATAKIKELNEQLRTLKKIHVCKECGATVPLDAVFCSRCGTKLMHEEQPVSTSEAEVEEVVEEEDIVEVDPVEEVQGEVLDEEKTEE